MTILKDLDHAIVTDIKPLYNYKLSTIKQGKDEAEEVMKDFRAGVNDPSREAAKLEKNLFLD